MKIKLKEGERIDNLEIKNMKIISKSFSYFQFHLNYSHYNY